MNSKSRQLAFFLMLSFVLSLFLSSTGEKYLRRLFNSPKSYSDIQNPASSIVKLLLQQNDFPIEWEWDLINTYQVEKPSMINRDGVVEYAERKFYGFYNGNQVRITHVVYRFANASYSGNFEIASELSSIGVFAIQNSYKIGLISSTGKRQDFNCYLGVDNYQNMVTRCVLGLEHQFLFEGIFVDLYGDINQSTIKEILSTVYEYLES